MADDTATPTRARKRRADRSEKSLRAEAKFIEIVAREGARSLEPEWTGTTAPHKIMCRKGHISHPYPGKVIRGIGVCGGCVGRNGEAERFFRDRLNQERVAMLDPYETARTKVRFRCWMGHEFISTPAHLVRKKSLMCRFCAGHHDESRFAAFRTRVQAQGGVLLETSWLGAHKPHDVLCREGHLCSPRPSGLLSGKSICRICACRDPHVVEARFRERVAELGGTVLGSWTTIHTPVLVRCSNGHEVTPAPNGVIRGGGLCRFCKGKAWDVFYVVQDDINDVLKFGVTSGNPRIRLAVHERDGFDRVVRLAEGLPGDAAPELERTLIAALRDAREKPVRGREYYHVRALALVLDLVDNHPAIRAAL